MSTWAANEHLAIVSKAAINIGVHILLKLVFGVPSDIFPEVETLIHNTVSFLIF